MISATMTAQGHFIIFRSAIEDERFWGELQRGLRSGGKPIWAGFNRTVADEFVLAIGTEAVFLAGEDFLPCPRRNHVGARL